MRKASSRQILCIASFLTLLFASCSGNKQAPSEVSAGPAVNPIKWIMQQQSALTPWEVSGKIIRELKP